MEQERKLNPEDEELLFSKLFDLYEAWVNGRLGESRSESDSIIDRLTDKFAELSELPVEHPICESFRSFCAGVNTAFEFQAYTQSQNSNGKGR